MRKSGESPASRHRAADGRPAPAVAGGGIRKRRLYFEDVEVRRSRTRGVACRVTLRKGEDTFVGEADGMENERQRIELGVASDAGGDHGGRGRHPGAGAGGVPDGGRVRAPVRVRGVTARFGRESSLLTGSAEVKESPEQSGGTGGPGRDQPLGGVSEGVGPLLNACCRRDYSIVHIFGNL